MQPSSDLPILRTKLYRPPVAADALARERLVARLEAGRPLPLTLVSAPAGYGKSTLVSHWLETPDVPSAWLSLDETEDDPRAFLEYLVAAVAGLHPESCPQVRALLRGGELPATPVIAARLTHDLDRIEGRFVLALDDYHRITSVAVHDLVDFLVGQALPSVHLVLLCRRDPLLSLARYRGRHQMTEIRLPDIRFTAAETVELLTRALEEAMSEADAERLHQVTEGWPVAVRLAIGAAGRQEHVEELVDGVGSGAASAQEFLLEEVLLRQPPAMQRWLRNTSILKRFCPGLVEAVSATGPPAADEGLTGEEFARRLGEAGLPVVALDARRHWCRYHHLVGDLLRRRLEAELVPDQVTDLHARAAAWLEGKGLLEESLRHRLAAGQLLEAAALVLRHKDALLENEQWHRLDHWLALLPPAVGDADPELILLKVWSYEHRGRYQETIRLFEQAKTLVDGIVDQGRRELLCAEIDVMDAGRDYHARDFAVALEKSRRARRRIARKSEWVWVFATRVEAMSRQMVGDTRGSFATVDDSLESGRPISEMARGHLLGSRGILQWIAADRAGLERTARAILAYPWSRDLAETKSVGSYLLGAALYHADRLEEAAAVLEPIATDPAPPSVANQLRAAYALASIHQYRGRGDAARSLLDDAGERLHHAGNTTFLPELDAFRAELRQGRVAAALRWAEGFEPVFASAAYSFFLPELTAVKARLADGSATSLIRARDRVERHVRDLEASHCTRFLIEALALRALCREAAGEHDAARADFARALELAQPGGYVRLFVDLGPALAPLLHAVELDQEKMRYVGEILSAFPEPSADQPLIGPLTPRELEILELVALRLGNREIGERLNIAPGTVKRHTHGIYGKLGVHDRWHAVDKARGLGMLASR